MVTFTIGGTSYNITNWKEIERKLLSAIGKQVEDAIADEIENLGLQATGVLFGSIQHKEPENGQVVVFSDAPHAAHIEFGTAGTKKGVNDPFGQSSRGPNPRRKMPLKKDSDRFRLVPELEAWAKRKGIPREAWFALAKRIQEQGLEPFAPFRRVLFNEKKMQVITQRAFNAASK